MPQAIDSTNPSAKFADHVAHGLKCRAPIIGQRLEILKDRIRIRLHRRILRQPSHAGQRTAPELLETIAQLVILRTDSGEHRPESMQWNDRHRRDR